MTADVGKIPPAAALQMLFDVLLQGGNLHTKIAGNGPTIEQVVRKALERPFLPEDRALALVDNVLSRRVVDLLAHIDALTARLAEAERALREIGERAIVDWQDELIGLVSVGLGTADWDSVVTMEKHVVRAEQARRYQAEQRLAEVEGQNMRCLNDIMRLERQLAEAHAAIASVHFHHKAFEPLCRHCQAALTPPPTPGGQGTEYGMSERKMAYEVTDPRGYSVRCWYGREPGSRADIEICKGEEVIRAFQYEGYRVWNIAAHFSEIVDEILGPAPTPPREGGEG